MKAIEKSMQSASQDIYEIVSENLAVVFWNSNVINGWWVNSVLINAVIEMSKTELGNTLAEMLMYWVLFCIEGVLGKKINCGIQTLRGIWFTK